MDSRTLSKKASSARAKNPERLSGHKLVDYLTEHPDVQGTFKWHTLRSCMWRRLLSACPQYASFVDYGKITVRDAKNILLAQWQLISRFDIGQFTPYDWTELLIAHPELSNYCELDSLHGYFWVLILQEQPSLASKCRWEVLSNRNWCALLRKHKEFADRCPWEKFSGGDWSELLLANSSFADRCPWKSLSPRSWRSLIRGKPCFLRHYTLDLFSGPEDYFALLEESCLGDTARPHGMFENFSGDTASYLLCKVMDRENGARYLKERYLKKDWAFLEELCDISPEELLAAAPGKKQIPFLIALKAPDTLFRKFFHTVNSSLRDRVGNTLLHYALARDLRSGETARYPFLLERGCDPEVKNEAGFSCQDLLKHIETMKKTEGR